MIPEHIEALAATEIELDEEVMQRIDGILADAVPVSVPLPRPREASDRA